jgi:hypothetical protein
MAGSSTPTEFKFVSLVFPPVHGVATDAHAFGEFFGVDGNIVGENLCYLVAGDGFT